MLTDLSIRDVVLIERLDLRFGAGLSVLTGETGAGKSILLDSLGLALGGRADAGLIRTGAAEAHVTAGFAPPAGHPVLAILDELGLPAEETLTLRRVIEKSGRSRAFVNDAPCGIAALRRIGSALVEISGQHDQMGLADPASHMALLDSFGTNPGLITQTATAFRSWQNAAIALEAAQTKITDARREEDYLRHATDELSKLAPVAGEEDTLADRRQGLQQGEKRAEAVAAALAELSPRDRRSANPASALRSAARALSRLAPARGAETADHPATAAMAAIERAEEALIEAEGELSRLAHEADADPRLLEQVEERLFALRAAARKHSVAVSELPALLARMRDRLAALDHGEKHLSLCIKACTAARAQFGTAADLLSASRAAAATKLQTQVARELPPLRLDKAKFYASLTRNPETAWNAHGADDVRFLIATNPGQDPGPLGKIASGGELSRLMLALKVVLAAGSPVPTLVFDEVDSGIGGASAAAVGDRLARVALGVQVLVVTHSPQVAARGAAHLRVAKHVRAGRTETDVVVLSATERREEIARMLAGEIITDAARAAAESLLAAV